MLKQKSLDPQLLGYGNANCMPPSVFLFTPQWNFNSYRPNGVRFTAAASSQLKRSPPQEGAVVSFRHSGFLLATKKPKLPFLHRIRADVSWDDVLQNWNEGAKDRTLLKCEYWQSRCSPLKFVEVYWWHLFAVPHKAKDRERKSKGYWRDRANRRQFFLDFARSHNFDPFVAENWKDVSKAAIGKAVSYLLKDLATRV